MRYLLKQWVTTYIRFSVTRDREGAYNLRKHTGRWITGTDLDDFGLALVYANPLSAHEDDLTRCSRRLSVPYSFYLFGSRPMRAGIRCEISGVQRTQHYWLRS